MSAAHSHPGRLRLAFLLGIVFIPALAQAEDRVPAPDPLDRAVSRIRVPDGFKVQLFAGEPDVRQPIALTFDTRGRLWVVECDSYPAWKTPNVKRKDRVVIFEDTDRDGKFDTRKLFWDQGDNLTGIELGFGGVWLCSTPNLIFVPDRDADDRPDSAPEIVLDGWDVRAEHNMFNGLVWGPDGWLWGCNGIMSNSRVGRPGASDAERVPINCGVWRYHPTRRTFEAVAHGTTNPWGLDFDDYGEAFLTNCVIPHLFHVVPGARFQRMYGQDFNPHAYELIVSAADHLHWAGGRWQDSRGGWGMHGELGGGHAHSGAMIYLGGAWPAEYRNSVLMGNLHGNRLNRDVLKPNGSTYQASHAKDFLASQDVWFRPIAMRAAPDGSVFVLDWSDTDECHDTDSHGPERATGRIYRVSYGTERPERGDLRALSDDDLVRLQSSLNDWQVRQARLILQERRAAGRLTDPTPAALKKGLSEADSSQRKLRILWALNAIGALKTTDLEAGLGHEDEHFRAWSVALIGDSAISAATAARLEAMAATEPSAKVRLRLASVLQRIAPENRWGLASALASRAEDARDPYLPLLLWLGLEPAVIPAGPKAAELASTTPIPPLQRFLARRLILDSTDNAAARRLTELLRDDARPDFQVSVLQGMLNALRDRASAPMPAGWDRTASALSSSKRSEVRRSALFLSLIFGDPQAPAALMNVVQDRGAEPTGRESALRALAIRRYEPLAASLTTLLDDPAIRAAVLRILPSYPAAPIATARTILDRYPKLNESERGDAVAALASRPEWALALLRSIGEGKTPRGDLTANLARQIQAFPDRAIAGALEKNWGAIRPASQAKASRIAKYQALMTAENRAKADPARGRVAFQRVCASCHRLFDGGGEIGPDLTGAQRDNLDYVLENVLDPSASVGREHRLTIVETKDGRVLSGIVRESSPNALTLQTVNDRAILPRSEIERLVESNHSMMPEGLFDALTDDEVRDLIVYLGGKTQAKLPDASR